MSNILENNTIPEPFQPTKEQLLNRAVNQLSQMARETFNQMVRTQRRGIEIVWENPNLTAQEILSQFGENGQKLVSFHAKLTQLIYEASVMDGVQVELKFPTNAMEFDNGVVTVTDDPYVIPTP
jgi:hypothetical protein